MDLQPTLDAYPIAAIKDVALPTEVIGLPINPSVVRAIMERCPIVLEDPVSSSSYNERQRSTLEPYLWQAGDNHKRSFQITIPGFEEPWQDEYGNTYNALSLKGINFGKPSIIEHPTASEGYIAYGLQESSIIERVVGVSQILRAAGVSTEYILGVAEPQSYPWVTPGNSGNGPEMLSLPDYKNKLVATYWATLPPDKRTNEFLEVLQDKFEHMTFYITLRATDSPYRLADLSNESARSHTFEYVNKHLLKPGDSPFDIAKPEDSVRYLTDYFAPRAGRNLAKLHEHLAHGFATDLNYTALGGLVDADSVHGEILGLGDKPVGAYAWGKDLTSSLTALWMSIVSAKDLSGLPAGKAFIKNYFEEAVGQHAGDSGLETVTERLQEALGNLMSTIAFIDRDNFKPGWDALEAYVADDLLYLGKRLANTTLKDRVQEIFERLSDHPQLLQDTEEMFNDEQSWLALCIIRHLTEILEPEVMERDDFDPLASYLQLDPATPQANYPSFESSIAAIHRDLVLSYMIDALDIAELDLPFTDSGTREFVWRNILRLSDCDTETVVAERVTALFEKHAESMRQHLHYSKPQAVLEGFRTQLCKPLEKGRYWRATSHVPKLISEAYVLGLEDECLSEDIKFSAQTVTIDLSNAERLIEAISDGDFINSFELSERGRGSTLVMIFNKMPTYVLLRMEDIANGQPQHVMLEALELPVNH